MNKKLVGLAVLGFLFSTFTVQASGAVDGGGISKLYLICDNQKHPSISYNVQVVSGFFSVGGQRTWTMGADIRSLSHFSNEETLLASVAVRTNSSLTEIYGENFSLVQSGPGNYDMKTFPAKMTLKLENGNEISADLQCTIH